jgi:hypothetical protein
MKNHHIHISLRNQLELPTAHVSSRCSDGHRGCACRFCTHGRHEANGPRAAHEDVVPTAHLAPEKGMVSSRKNV